MGRRTTYLLAFPVLCAAPAYAQQNSNASPSTALYVSTGAAYSDNIRQSRDAPKSDVIALAALNGDYVHDGRNIDFGIGTDLAWVKYASGDYDDSSQGYLDSYANWATDAGRLTFGVRETFGQSRIDPTANSTPDNREYVNNLSAGPGLNFQIGKRSKLKLDAVYTRNTYETSLLSSSVYDGGATFEWARSKNASLNAIGRWSRTEYDDTTIADNFDLTEYSLSYSVRAQERYSMLIEVGRSRIVNDFGSASTPLLRLRLSRDIGGSSTVYVEGERRIGTAAEFSRSGTVGVRLGEENARISIGGAVDAKGARLGWRLNNPRSSAEIGGAWSEEQYADNPQFDRRVYSVAGRFDYKLSPVWTLEPGASYRDENMLNPVLPDVKLTTVNLALSRVISKRLVLTASATHQHRSDAGQFEFTENRVGLQIGYNLVALGN